MIIERSEILLIAESTGFKADIVEKALHLLNMLNMLNSHPALKGKLALKGGTALNLFIFKIPRMSVDMDLNYIGALSREAMLKDRPYIDKAILAVAAREGLTVKRMPDSHAGGKYRLNFQSYTGQSGNIEIDLNFMFRQPLWDPNSMDSHILGAYQARSIPVLDIHELAAGKLAALFSRRQVRDLFDAHHLLFHKNFDQESLRIAFVIYGAFNRKDWRKISIEDVTFNTNEIDRTLLPVLRCNMISNKVEKSQFAEQLINECRDRLSQVFPFTESEMEFLSQILDKGKILPDIITTDTELQNRIERHPMLHWKVNNIRKHFGLSIN